MMTQQPGKREAETVLWEQHKKTMKFMFLKQENTLMQVRDRMASQFRFERTPAQYERRFKDWGFRKNLTSREWKRAHSIIEGRKRCGKPSLVNTGSSRIDGSTMQKRAKRHSYETTLERIGRLQDKSSEPIVKTLVIRTPSPDLRVSDKQRELFSQSTWYSCLRLLKSIVVRYDQIQHFAAQSCTESLVADEMSVQYSEKPIFFASAFAKYIHNIDYTRKLLLATSPCGIAMDIDKTLALRTGEAWADLLKASVFLLSNNLDEQTHIGKLIVESCQSPTNLQMLERLLRLKHPTIQAFAERLLAHAAAAGDVSLTKLLLQSGTHPNGSLSEDYIDALGAAILNHRTTITALLIDAGADLNRVSSRHGTILMMALESNCLEIVHMLLLRNIDIRSNSEIYSEAGRWNALSRATVFGGINAVKLLEKHDKAIFRELMTQGNPTPIQLAASLGNEAVMRLFLEHGGNVNQVNSKGLGSALSAAIASGKSTMADLLLSVGANVNTHSDLVFRMDVYKKGQLFDRRLATPLQEAVWQNDTALSKTLIERGADPNPRLYYNTGNASYHFGLWKTPLALAILHGNDSLVQLLLEAGADLNSRPFCSVRRIFTLSPLNYATLTGDKIMIKLLLNYGALPDEGTLVLASQSGLLDFVQFLLDKGICINATALLPTSSNLEDPDSPYVTKSVLTAAIWSENEELIELLLRKGVNVNNPSIDQEWETPLSRAIESKRLDWARALIAHGADPRDSCALCAAVRTDQPIILEILLSSCQEQFDCGLGEFAFPALIRAIQEDNERWIRTLINTGVPLNSEARIPYSIDKFDCYDGRGMHPKDFSGLPLTCATMVASPNTVKLLIDHGADPSLGLLLWWSNLSWVKPREDDRTIQIVKILLNAGAKTGPNSCSEFQYSVPLVKAIEWECYVSVELLLLHGADVNSRSLLQNETATPLQVSAYHGLYSIVRKLLELGADIYAPAGSVPPSYPSSGSSGTAIELAVEKGRLDVLCLLLEAEAGQEHKFMNYYSKLLRVSYKSGFRAIFEYLKTYKRERCSHLSSRLDEEILNTESSENTVRDNWKYEPETYDMELYSTVLNGKEYDGDGDEVEGMISGNESDDTSMMSGSHMLNEYEKLRENKAIHPHDAFDPTNTVRVATKANKTDDRSETDYDAIFDEFFEREIYELFE